MPGVVSPQQKPGAMQQALGGLQAAQSIMSMKNSMGDQPQADPNAAPQAGATGDPDQEAKRAAIQRGIQTRQGGGY